MSIAALHSLPAVYAVSPGGRRVGRQARLGLRASSVETAAAAVAVNGEAGVDKKKLDDERRGKEEERRLEVLYDDGFWGVTVKDYVAAARAVSKDDGGPPRWFCPVESGRPAVDKAPLLLFLPGIDGVGMGLILHHKSLGKLKHGGDHGR